MILIQVETGRSFMTLPRINNIDNISNKRLSVQFSLTGLSFLVTQPSTKEVSFFLEKKLESNPSPEELLECLKKAIRENEGLQENFDEIIVIYATNLYALVPTSLFDETKASDYLKLNSKILANDFVAYDTLENSDLTIVYIPYININNYLFERFGLFKYFHSTTLLLNYILNVEKHAKKPKVYLNVMDNLFDIIVMKNGGLLLCNTYEYKTPEDFIYYILFCLEQLKLNPDSIEFIISGNINQDDDLYSILYTYIRNISFIKHEFHPAILSEDDEMIHHDLLLKLAQ